MWTIDDLDPNLPARRVTTLVDALVARARPLTPLIEFHRAHLEAFDPGASRSSGEHLIDLLTVGLRWRMHARDVLRRPTARPEHETMRGLVTRLRLSGVPRHELARLLSWLDFARDEGCHEALDEAVALAAWFEAAADATLSEVTPRLEEQLELVRTEVLARALRARPHGTGTVSRSTPRKPFPTTSPSRQAAQLGRPRW